MQKLPNKELRNLSKQVRPHGWTWRISGSGHVIFTGPSGGRVVVASSHSDVKAMANTKMRFRQQGLPL